MRLKRLELDDINLQIQIVNTKLSVRDGEYNERKKLLRKKTEQLNKIRAKVREVIAADKELRDVIKDSITWDEEMDYDNNTREEECTLIVELLKELKYDQVVPDIDVEVSGPASGEKMDCENKSAAESECKQDCQIKIVKVTNVYKVAYLRHYIRQKRLRRANKQAMLRKKMDDIKKLLDDWQRTLNMVINSKVPLINMNSQYIDIPSQEAMGDCFQTELLHPIRFRQRLQKQR
ncbi:unnamed protein product [Danaus chrysippus]|uniref:(African queen) hypothetical protein n=1 Tax=Danaus chrysippus TaxID=151541 RepID=A0A8J2R258_9NEOP|nr:unnamed protein product [Danaus chrysippus]